MAVVLATAFAGIIAPVLATLPIAPQNLLASELVGMVALHLIPMCGLVNFPTHLAIECPSPIFLSWDHVY